MSKICYQLKIQLNGSEPPVWRRIQVLGDTALDRLHDIIQVAMGWDGEHHYQFIINEHYYSSDDLGHSFDRSEAHQVTLGQLIKRAKTTFLYEYDLSDGWEHEVAVEQLRPISDLDAQQLPFCMAGENACPPEDCGGIFGYFELLSILKDPKHPAYQEMVDTYGQLDPRQFELEQVQRSLKILF